MNNMRNTTRYQSSDLKGVGLKHRIGDNINVYLKCGVSGLDSSGSEQDPAVSGANANTIKHSVS